MPKCVSPPEMVLGPRPEGVTLVRWLHRELRQAILDGRLKPGTRLPASRDFAKHYHLSRGTVLTVFEELEAEGYLRSRVGSGTWISEFAERTRCEAEPQDPPSILPNPLTGLSYPPPARPFRCHEPALEEFPLQIWARLSNRRLRRMSSSSLAERDPRGHRLLREALTEYLAVSRGVKCSPEQIVIVSGVQQALDILARVLLRPDDWVWVEDPGYFGAVLAFRNARARIVPVPVDDEGLSVEAGKKRAIHAKAAYLTPAHQFPLGVVMSPQRRTQILAWACAVGAFLIEDDYDGEYRFVGRPIPSLQGSDDNGRVIFLGTFNKMLFSSLRLGYMVLPAALVDPVLGLRFGLDQNSVGIEQGVLFDFIAEGHLGRHVRRMRELYATRLAILQEESRRRLDGLLEIPPIHAGLSTIGLLRNGISSRAAESAAGSHGIESMAIDRFTLARNDVHGLLLGFAAFGESQIRHGVATLEAALTRIATKRAKVV